jgi:peptidoglycan/xylan/chitin deacetylase (PgdA/CDA1 family)
MARGVYYALGGFGHALSRRPDPYWNFEKVMELEARAGYRSTFFFVPEAASADRDPPYELDTPPLRQLLVRLGAGGWEVGVHGNYDSHLDAASLRAQREKLERVWGEQVRGVRQHYLRLEVPETFRAQMEAGFAYDGTVGYRSHVGFRAGAAFPFHPFDPTTGQKMDLLELPLAVMDGPLFWQLKLSPSEASARTLALLDRVRSVGGLAVLLWHQRAWHDRRYPGWGQVYGAALDYLREEGRAWVATAGEVADWWLAREAVQLEAVSLQGRSCRWRYRTGAAVQDLVFRLCHGGAGSATVAGAGAAIQAVEGGARLALQPLCAGQSFEIEWTLEEPS